MSKENSDITELFIDSLTEHAGLRRLADLRNEDSEGLQRTAGKAKGDALTAFDKEDFRQHLRQTLSDPNTKYFIDESNGRIAFFNADQSNNTRAVFNPAQFTDGDGHAGTLMRDSVKDGEKNFLNELNRSTKNMNGVAPEVRFVSDGGHIEHLEKYRAQLENVPERVLGKGDLRTDYHRAGETVKTQTLLPLDYNAPNAPKVPQNIALEVTEEVAEKSMLRGAFEAAAPMLRTTGMVVLGAIPVIGMLPNTVEAAELKDKLDTAIENGQISQDALLEYDAILTGHIAQGADPTIIMGEAGVQKSFQDWADRNNVQGELRSSLQPTSLALMMKDGGTYIAQNIERLPSATVDVGIFAGQTAVEGAGIAANAIDSAYDDWSGNTAQMQSIYDALPVLGAAANEDLYELSDADADPIHNYPTAHDMAQIKTQIVNTQEAIEQINNGAKEPFNGMNKAESADFLQERITRLNDRFESTYDAAKADGTLDEVMDYTAHYGMNNIQSIQPSLAIQNTEPAANQSWDAPKTRALAM